MILLVFTFWRYYIGGGGGEYSRKSFLKDSTVAQIQHKFVFCQSDENLSYLIQDFLKCCRFFAKNVKLGNAMKRNP